MLALFFDPTPPPQKNANYFRYNVKSLDIALYSVYFVKILERTEKIICGYLLRKPDSRLKRILKRSHSAEKFKRVTLRAI